MRRQSKHEKYNTGNPISCLLVSQFFKTVSGLYSRLEDVESILDAGCGEGVLTEHLYQISPVPRWHALDINPEEVADAALRLPFCRTSVGSLYDLSYADQSFDMVICCEVLEHLDTPEWALGELKRVCKGYAILSVPKEPLWRMMNLARLKYIKRLGNTPNHIQHWSTKGFLKMVSRYFEIMEVRTPIPWSVVLCKTLSK